MRDFPHDCGMVDTYGLWPNRTARSLSRAWPSLLRAHNHIGGATAVPLHHKKCLLCSVLIYIVLAGVSSGSWGSGLLTGGISDNLYLENNLFKNQADLN